MFRKRFDSIKYDLKKVEEVVYDLSIRGLGKQPLDLATQEAKEKEDAAEVKDQVDNESKEEESKS